MEDCLLCGKAAHLKCKDYPGYQRPLKFEIYHCDFCKSAFSLPRVNTTQLYEDIYRSGKELPGYDRYWKYAERINSTSSPLNYLAYNESAYWGVKKSLEEIVTNKQGTKILEIGSGMGYLTYSLIKEDYNVVGLDISDVAVKTANYKFGNYFVCADLYEYSTLHSESFDVVILTEVIEHVEKPVDFIRAILKVLRSDGRIIITTPNRSIYDNKVIWASDSPPVHLWWFSEDSMRFIANELNIEIDFISFNEFYKRNYQSIEMADNKISILPSPYLDETGELLVKANESIFKGKIKDLLIMMPSIRNVYRKFLDIFRKDRFVCGQKGTVLCAILRK
jgi:SAM-dependent methyltransferase